MVSDFVFIGGFIAFVVVIAGGVEAWLAVQRWNRWIQSGFEEQEEWMRH